jgi:hypothetical protein
MDGVIDIETLERDLAKTTAEGLSNGVHRDDAVRRQTAANDKQALGGGALALGVAVAAVGAWLIAPPAPAKKSKRATLAPALGTPGLVAVFHF